MQVQPNCNPNCNPGLNGWAEDLTSILNAASNDVTQIMQAQYPSTGQIIQHAGGQTLTQFQASFQQNPMLYLAGGALVLYLLFGRK